MSKKSLFLLLVAFVLSLPAMATDCVELRLSGCNKVVFKFMFGNGSIADPVGQEALTFVTTVLAGGGGTSTMTSKQLKDFLDPMAAEISYSVDKEVATFTCKVHVDHRDNFYPVL